MSAKTKSLYDTLGVLPEATNKEIQKAFRQLSKTVHPDINDASDAAERFAEIKEAYEVLMDKELRARYDKQLKSNGGPFKQESTFDDIFSAFFNNKRTANVPIHGENIEMAIEVTAEELLRAAPKEVNVRKNKACTDCSGSGKKESKGKCKECKGEGFKPKKTITPFGQLETADRCESCKGSGKAETEECPTCTGKGTIPEYEKFEFTLNPQSNFGMTMVFKHRGHAGIDGGETGDLRILVKQSENDKVRVTFDVDLNETKRVPLQKVLDGSDYLVVFPDGTTEEVELSEEMNKGSILVFLEKGLMDEKGNRGFYNLEIIVEYPELTRLQRNKILDLLEVK